MSDKQFRLFCLKLSHNMLPDQKVRRRGTSIGMTAAQRRLAWIDAILPRAHRTPAAIDLVHSEGASPHDVVPSRLTCCHVPFVHGPPFCISMPLQVPRD
jgi:hypothetical protein